MVDFLITSPTSYESRYSLAEGYEVDSHNMMLQSQRLGLDIFCRCLYRAVSADGTLKISFIVVMFAAHLGSDRDGPTFTSYRLYRV